MDGRIECRYSTAATLSAQITSPRPALGMEVPKTRWPSTDDSIEERGYRSYLGMFAGSHRPPCRSSPWGGGMIRNKRDMPGPASASTGGGGSREHGAQDTLATERRAVSEGCAGRSIAERGRRGDDHCGLTQKTGLPGPSSPSSPSTAVRQAAVVVPALSGQS